MINRTFAVSPKKLLTTLGVLTVLVGFAYSPCNTKHVQTTTTLHPDSQHPNRLDPDRSLHRSAEANKNYPESKFEAGPMGKQDSVKFSQFQYISIHFVFGAWSLPKPKFTESSF